MPQLNHTPGPWTITSDDGSSAAGGMPSLIIETEDRHIAFAFDDAQADARLIAAAPDLLAVCQRLSDSDKEGDQICYIIADARAAIAKATAPAGQDAGSGHDAEGK